MKRLLLIFLAVILIGNVFILSSYKEEEGEPTVSASVSTSDPTTQKYNYDMTRYITVPSITGTEISVNLDNVQMTIDQDIMNVSTEKILALAGDDIEVIITIKEYKEIGVDDNGNKIDQIGELWYSTDNAETIDTREAILISNFGNGNFLKSLEEKIIGATLGQAVTQNDFIIPQDIETMTNLKNNYPEAYEALTPHAGERAYLTYEFVSRPVKEGDVVRVTYTGYYTDENGEILIVDGKEQTFKGGSGTSKVYIGSRTFITDFEKGLIGMSVGKQGQLKATFPSDYGAEDLNGKTVIFKATIISIYQVPEYNAELVKELYGEKYESTDALENAIIESYANQKILDYLISNSTVIEYPQVEFDYLLEQLKEQEETIQDQYSMTLEEYIKAVGYASVDDYVQKVMKSEMAYYAYAQARGIEITEQDITDIKQAFIDDYTDSYLASSKDLTEDEARQRATEYVEGFSGAFFYQEALYKKVKADVITQYTLVKVPATYTSVTKGGSLFD